MSSFAYKAPNLAIFGKMIGNIAKIEFPKMPAYDEIPAMPELGRDFSIRSYISGIMNRIGPLE